MDETKKIPEAVSSILFLGLVKLRELSSIGDMKRCKIEANHLHNLPALLVNLDPNLINFYMNVERVEYLRDLEKNFGSEEVQHASRLYRSEWEVLSRVENESGSTLGPEGQSTKR